MKTYRVKTFAVYTISYSVEANSREEAIKKAETACEEDSWGPEYERPLDSSEWEAEEVPEDPNAT